MSTVNDLCAAALREIGVLAGGEAAPYNDAADAFSTLNRMVDQWRVERLNIPNRVRTVWPITANVGEYVFGGAAPANRHLVSDGFDGDWIPQDALSSAIAASGVPPGWTVTAGTGAVISRDTTTQQAGAAAVRLVPNGADTISMQRTVPCHSGEQVTISIYLKVTPGGTVAVQIYNPDTAYYLTSAGQWQTTSTNLFTVTSTSWAQSEFVFNVQAASVVGDLGTRLRITLYPLDITIGGYFDTLELTFSGATNSIPIPKPQFIDQVNLLDTSTDPDFEIPLSPLTDDGWADVREKALTDSYPSHWYYNPTHPNGTLSLWPVPTGSGLKLVLYVPTAVSTFAALSTQVVLPPGYERMIVKNLAVELAPSYGRQPSPLLLQQASEARATVKRSNYRMREMSSEAALMFSQHSTFDIRTGR